MEETKNVGQKFIVRQAVEKRNDGSLLENTINQIAFRYKLANKKKNTPFEMWKEKLQSENDFFSYSLELCLTWLNRILFLKLLEGQLLKYHRNDKKYAFLSNEKIKDFNELNELFFEVLDENEEARSVVVKEKFGNLPFLNSSLFELTDLEMQLFLISNLKHRLEIPIYEHTVLKNEIGKKQKGKKKTLEYLLEFLDAYNFASDGNASIQEENKTIINAAVLGLIFEKINGYQDGSFFTPSFVTMYMCRKSIRAAVVQKFNDTYKWKCRNFDDLFNKLDLIRIDEANKTFNTIKICDPAVGSGHFLVSALNEMIAIKSELRILIDKRGRRLRGYKAVVENDELIIYLDEEFYEPQVYQYFYKSESSQRIQETLFHEKQLLIENCLFGVDINPKSVMICRLRLWIELLKNMYYTKASNYTRLETLPNIDINIKVGNSLVYQFDLNDDYKKLPANVKQKIRMATQKYKEQVFLYKNTSDKITKGIIEANIEKLKQSFKDISQSTDSIYLQKKKKEKELGETPITFTKEERVAWRRKAIQLAKDIKSLEQQYQEKVDTLYSNSLEWRFEFPEVLDENGNFVGFDLVVGNPPYIRQEKLDAELKHFYLKKFGNVGTGTADIYVYFFGLALQIAKPNNFIHFITLNKWLKTKYGKTLRTALAKQNVLEIIDFFELNVFESASTDSATTMFQKMKNNSTTKYFPVNSLENLDLWTLSQQKNYLNVQKNETEWLFYRHKKEIDILPKISKNATDLYDFVNEKMYMGVKTGANEVFIIDDTEKEKLCKTDPKSAEIIAPYASPTNFERYGIAGAPQWFINSHNGILVSKEDFDLYSETKDGKTFLNYKGNYFEVKNKEEYGKTKFRINRIDVEKDYTAIYKYLAKHKKKLTQRGDKGVHWTNLRNCDYVYEFANQKIIYVYTAKNHPFYLDEKGHLLNNSSYMLISSNLYLWAFLNSKLFAWYKKIKFVAYGNAEKGGRVKLDFNKMAKVPIKNISTAQQQAFDEKINALLALKKENSAADVSKQEAILDSMIYEVYGITDAERAVIEKE